MRTVAVVFQVWLSSRIGAAGIGLFQLVMSVSMLASTFAISGIRFSVTRLAAEELARGRPDWAAAAVRRCLVYAAVFGTAAFILLAAGAEYIGTVWIGDSRTVLSLRILAISLPFLAMSAVFGGYFTACSRVIKSALVQILEQFIRIFVIFVMLSRAPDMGAEHACASIVAGGVAGECSSFVFLAAVYALDKRKHLKEPSGRHPGLNSRMLSISIPLALSAYARTALSTLEHLLVPRGFKKAGLSAEKALSDYGVIQGMVFPVITFPSVFFSALAELLVPELTHAQATGNSDFISSAAGRLLYLCYIFSAGAAAILFCFSGYLGMGIYSSPEAGAYIRLLAPIIIIMYLDTVTDGILKGLGQQLHSMAYNIMDAVLSVVMVYTLLPLFAVKAYIFILYFTECFNFFLSLRRMLKVTVPCIRLRDYLKTSLCAIGAISFVRLFMNYTGFDLMAPCICAAVLIYAALLKITGSVGAGDMDWIRALLKEDAAPSAAKVR